MEKATDEDMSTILFLCCADEQQLKSIEDSFNKEADRAELRWQARASNLSDFNSSTQIINDAGKIIILAEPAQKGLYVDLLAKNAAKIVLWEIESVANLQVILEQELKGLVVRLILEGGKRKSADSGRQTICSRCKKSASYCICGSAGTNDVQSKNTKSTTSFVRVMLERKGRRGKDVTVLTGFSKEQDLDELAARFKKVCGSGGTIKDGQIEIQGDHRVKLIAELEAKGFKCKRVGG